MCWLLVMDNENGLYFIHVFLGCISVVMWLRCTGNIRGIGSGSVDSWIFLKISELGWVWGHNPQGNSKMEEWRLFCIKDLGLYRFKYVWSLLLGHVILYLDIFGDFDCLSNLHAENTCQRRTFSHLFQEKAIYNILNLCSGEIALRHPEHVLAWEEGKNM